MLIADIFAGIFMRILIVHITSIITGSNFLLNNKIINILGTASLIAVYLGAQNESVGIGVYVGFFFLDTLSTLIITAGLFKSTNIPEMSKKKKTRFVNEKRQ